MSSNLLGVEGSHFPVGQGPTYSLEFHLLRPHLLSSVCYWPGSGICVCDSCFRKVGKGEKEIGELRYLIPDKDDFQGEKKKRIITVSYTAALKGKEINKE